MHHHSRIPSASKQNRAFSIAPQYRRSSSHGKAEQPTCALQLTENMNVRNLSFGQRISCLVTNSCLCGFLFDTRTVTGTE